MDPRVKTSAEGLRQQFELETNITGAMHRDFVALQEVRSLREQLKKANRPEAAALDQKAAAIEGTEGFQYLSTPEGRSLTRLNAGFSQLLANVDGADTAPTSQASAMFGELDAGLRQQLEHWQEIKNKDLPALNEQLKKSGAAEVKISLADIETQMGEAEKAAGEDEP